MRDKGVAGLIWGVLWAISVELRLALAWFNREANDQHVQDVIVPLLKQGTGDSFLWYYHPKLYHYTVVFLIRLFDLQTLNAQIVCAQLVNALAGIATLVLLFRFLRTLDVPWPISCLVFGFFGLNPGLVGMSAQATNDAFVVLFVVAGTLAAAAYFRTAQSQVVVPAKRVTPNFVYLILVLLCIGLAMGTKGNGIGLAVAVGGVMLLNSLVALLRRGLNSARYLLEFCLLTIFSAAALISFKVYTLHLAYFRFLSSDRMVIGRFWGVPEGIPMFSARGLALLKSSLFALPFWDLLRNPVNHTPDTTGAPVTVIYPFQHMRNYWMQIYGNFSVARFHDWPPSWRVDSPAGEWLARALLSLNLVPVLLVLFGMGLVARAVISRTRASQGLLVASPTTDTTLLAVFLVFLLAGVRYFMIFPCYQFAKFIYIAPFLIPLAYGLACGLSWAWEQKNGPRYLLAVFVPLFVMNVVDLIWLIWDLAHVVP